VWLDHDGEGKQKGRKWENILRSLLTSSNPKRSKIGLRHRGENVVRKLQTKKGEAGLAKKAVTGGRIEIASRGQSETGVLWRRDLREQANG